MLNLLGDASQNIMPGGNAFGNYCSYYYHKKEKKIVFCSRVFTELAIHHGSVFNPLIPGVH